MRKVKKIRLKAPVVSFLKKVGVVLFIILILFFLYFKEINQLRKLGYSTESSRYILFHGKKDYILSIGENKTLNVAFESSDYKEEYISKYQNVKYFNQDNFIKNINNLIEKGYSINNINMIFEHGNSEDVTEFAKRDKVKYLEEFYSVPYAKLKYYDRYIAYSDMTGEDDNETVLIVNMDLDKENYTDAFEVTKFSTDMLVNKHRKLGEDFAPNDLTDIEVPYASEDGMKASKLAINAFIKMYKAAKKDGYGIVINSAYRSYQDQVELTQMYRDLYGDNYVTNYVAFPGYSEHQTGLCFDIGSTTTNVFINSKEYQWMQDNAYKYGFILRFPKQYEDVTGFRAEPWHYRYVGEKIAKYIHENNISFEEYYATFLDE